VTSQPPPYPGGNEFGTMPPYAGGAPTPPKNGLSIAALVLGIISIPAALTVWIGAICGVLAIVFGIIGLSQARKGRANKRALAVTGLITGVIGLVLSVVVFAYAVKRTQACQDRIGHAPSQTELEQCIRDGV
jgi:NADH:ubiquinone oxidoreductase subunit 6 (subunit J)